MSTLLAMTLDEAFNIVNASLGIPDDERSRVSQVSRIEQL